MPIPKQTTVLCQRETGIPEKVIQVETWDMPEPGKDQVLLKMEAAPINPADINMLEGRYAFQPPLPAVLGLEGIGTIEAVGDGVKDITPGQRAIVPRAVGTWCQYRIADADQVIVVPKSIDIEQAAMISVNPPTAWRMLEDFVVLRSGDWIVQNAANAGVGRCVIAIAHQRGLRTINIIRNPEQIAELKETGADIVITEEELLDKKLKQIVADKEILLGLNAVGGANAHEMSKCISRHGTMVTYGAMSKKPLQISNALLIFKDIRFVGFGLGDWFQVSSKQDKEKMFATIFEMAEKGSLDVPVEKTYPLRAATEAIIHAQRDKRKGKILFRMS